MAWWVQVQNFLSAKWYMLLNVAGPVLVAALLLLLAIRLARGRWRAG